MSRIPQAGEALTDEDLNMIFEAVLARQKNFPGEPMAVSISVTFAGIGDRFAPITCIEQEWSGLKADVVRNGDDLVCPNGHPVERGPGLRVGWIHNE